MHGGIVSVCKCLKHNEQLPPLSASLTYRSAAIGKCGFEEIRGSYETSSSVKFLNSNK